MSSNELVEQIMAQVIARVATPEQQALPDPPHPTGETAMAEKSCSLTEFVGTAMTPSGWSSPTWMPRCWKR
ncbi:propanediol utilization polyhedral body protein PduB [Klebsiella pneumoniae]|nr:propanediol utilization polyhedral body protein PduB [Klebsiella pneumoniae]